MKFIIAPDSFKESMTACEAAVAIEEGIHQYCSSVETLLCPLSDGGEGTLETLIHAMNGEMRYYVVKGPLFLDIKAPIGYVDDIAIIECAKVCGLELLNDSQKNPHQTTTYGLGQLMKHALDHGSRKLMICLGGSATNDGGIGMLLALGVSFLDNSFHQVQWTMDGLKDICYIDETHLDKRLQEIEIIGVCDVDNPLCGEKGATAIYGPQKGLLKHEIESVDNDMKRYAQLCDEKHHYDYRYISGAGAAGGLGYALISFVNGQLLPGFEVVAKVLSLEEKISSCDCVIVGEGKIDAQTQYGKTPYGVLKLAQKYHKKVYAFAGKVEDKDILKQLGFSGIFEISPRDIPLSHALKCGKEYLKESVNQHIEEIINEI